MLNYTTSSVSNGNFSLLLFVVIMALIVVMRIQRGIYGRKYKHWRTFFLPVVYMILTISIIISDWRLFGVYINISMFLLVIVGLMTGIRFGESVSFFKKGDILYYKRSPFILLFWLLSFIGRISIELFLPQIVLYAEILDGLLAFTSGLLLGEAFHIIRKRDDFLKTNQKQSIIQRTNE